MRRASVSGLQEQASALRSLRTWPTIAKTKIIRELVDFQGKVVMDVGCGKGMMCRYAYDLGASKVIGVDPSPRQIKEAKEQSTEYPEIEYMLASAQELPLQLEPNSIDIITFFNALHHVPEHCMNNAFHEASRVLKPGGQLVIYESISTGRNIDALFEVVEYEKVEKQAAYDATREQPFFTLYRVEFFQQSVVLQEYDDYRRLVLQTDSGYLDVLNANDALLRRLFARSAPLVDEKGHHFEYPARLELLRKNG